MSARQAPTIVLGIVLAPCLLAGAFAQMPNPYGLSISVEDAQESSCSSFAEAKKNNWAVAVAVVDPSGNLVYYEKMENTQLGSANISIDKARTAARFKRPTRAFQDALAAGGEGLRILGLEGITPVEGGFPLLVGWQDRRRDWSLRCDQRAGRSMRQSGCGRLQIKTGGTTLL